MHTTMDGVSVSRSTPIGVQTLKGCVPNTPPFTKIHKHLECKPSVKLFAGRILRSEYLPEALSLRTDSNVISTDKTIPFRLDLKGYRNTPEGSVFLSLALAKQSRPGREMKEFFFAQFIDNIKPCPSFSLTMYIERIKALKGDNTQLFIKPHNPVTSSTITLWLKEVMASADIQIPAYSKHTLSEVLVHRQLPCKVSPQRTS